jgi:hypothetical protein
MGIPVTSSFHTNFSQYTNDYRIGWLEPIVAAWLRRFHNRTLRTFAPTRELVSRLESEGFGDHQGPLVLEIPELPHAPPLPPRQFAEELSRFFARVSRAFSYAVELRDRLLLGPEYVEALQRHGVAHGFNYWERMPELSEQRRLVDIDSAGFGVVRLLIPPGMRYADRKRALEPFDRIASVQTAMREQTLSLIEAFAERRAALYVIANNKAEGSSPLTLRGLAEEWAARRSVGTDA